MLQMLSTQNIHENNFILVTAGSIQSKLAMNEKQGPTTTEMTAKSVIWSHEWCYRCCRHIEKRNIHENIFILVTAGSIHSELAMNEKQGPTTTEMTAKSVSWCYKCCRHIDKRNIHEKTKFILVTAGSIRIELAISEKQGPTTTEMTAKSVSWMMLQMLSKHW